MAGKGTSRFIMQRASAVILAPLTIWFLWNIIAHAGDSHAQMRAWLGAPVNTLIMGAVIIIGGYHMRIGMMEVIDDYIHTNLRHVLMVLNWFVSTAVVLSAIWAVIALIA